MKKVFVAIFSILSIAILLSASKVNAKVDVNIKEEVILGEKENKKDEVISGEEEKGKEENKPCVQSLNIGGSTRRSNGHQNKDWYNMGSYVSTGSVSSSCFSWSNPKNMINVRLNGANFEYSPLAHGNASVTVTVRKDCTCSGETISRTAGFTFSEWGLLELSIAGYDLSPEFDNMKSEYTAKVPNEVTSIKINGRSVDSGSDITISVNDTKIGEYKGKFEATIDNLKGSENEVKINVVTPEKVSRDTIITVTRSASDGGSNNDVSEGSAQLCTVDTAEQLAKILYHETGFGNFVGDENEYFFTELVTAGVIFNNMMRNGGNTYLEKIYNLTDTQYGGYSSYRDIPFSSSVSKDRKGELLYIAELVLTGEFALPSNITGQSSCKCLLGTKQCEGVNPELADRDCGLEDGWGVYWTHVNARDPKTLFDIYFGYSKFYKLEPVTITDVSLPSTDPAYFRQMASSLRKSDYSSYTSSTVCGGARSSVKLTDLVKNNSGGSSSGNGNVDSQEKPKVPISSFFLIKDNCLNPDVLRIVRFILVLIDVVRFVVPMALIVYGAIDFSKAAVAGDEKAQKEKVNLFVKRLINAVALFLVPVIVEFLIVFLGDLTSGVNFTDCIQNANKDKIMELQAELDKKREEIENEEIILEENNNYDYIIYIGDSRTVGMCYDVKLSDKENCELAKSGMGYSWLTSDAVKNNLDKILTDHKNSYVVINMGTNSGLSTNEGKAYATYYNELSKKYPTSKIVAISVTQVDPKLAKKNGMYVNTNFEVNSVSKFNEGLKGNLDSSVRYCDVYSALEKRGYNTPDGVHYAKETNEVIYEEIQKCLK